MVRAMRALRAEQEREIAADLLRRAPAGVVEAGEQRGVAEPPEADDKIVSLPRMRRHVPHDRARAAAGHLESGTIVPLRPAARPGAAGAAAAGGHDLRRTCKRLPPEAAAGGSPDLSGGDAA